MYMSHVKRAPKSTGSQSPKRLNKKFRHTGLTNHGNKTAGKENCHILSHEVFNCVLQHTRGRPYGDAKQKQISEELNSRVNLRRKTVQGNRFGYDGYSGDRYDDQNIIRALNSGRVLRNQRAVKRVRRAWAMTNKLNLPRSCKESIRTQFAKLRGRNGKVVIRRNARINKS